MQNHQRNIFLSVGIIVIVLIIGFCLDIQPKVMQLMELYSVTKSLHAQFNSEIELIHNEGPIRKQLQESLSQVSPVLRRDNKPNISAELISVVLRAAELNGLLITSIQPLQWMSESNLESLTIHVQAKGKFEQFTEFIALLRQYSLPIQLRDFSLHVEKNVLQMDMQLLGSYVVTIDPNHQPLMAWLSSKKFNLTRSPHDPFAHMAEKAFELTNLPEEASHLLSTFPMQQIKFAGYLRDHGKFWVLAKLPNGKTVEVKEGALFGIEKAKVLSLKEHEIVLEMAAREVRLPTNL